ncbi:hypothetical protein WJX81_003737 [Elliptochloris bilobata]|uniref:Uncharacterized protein n=1 Tax=Elliptochloris bilobata TaxID=381761 RepID=A0AAW1QDD0_9CHLO
MGHAVAEFFGATLGDPGHWNLSPEWYGTQGGGYGRDAGEVVFERESACGNGRVTPDCLAADYLKTVASAAAIVISAWPAELRRHCLQALCTDASGTGAAVASGDPARAAAAPGAASGLLPWRACAVCVGVGGGALPLFLSHHFPGLLVDAVELDAAVLEAATTAMGLPECRANLHLHCADGAEWVAQAAEAVHAQEQPPHDLVLLDAFDGDDAVPACFTQPGAPFLTSLADALHPRHGALVANLHCARPRAAWPWGARGGGDAVGAGARERAELAATARAFRDALLVPGNGAAWLAHAPQQANAVVVVARGVALPREPRQAARQLVDAARRTGAEAGFCFDAGNRAARLLQVIE